MGLMKKALTIFLAFSIMLINCNISYADTNNNKLTTNEKATVLKELDILRGTGTGFNLEGQLKRCEAAAFIVRLLCAEEEVMADKLKYSNTSFSDVTVFDWYAPYIGYCVENGIIGGYVDNSFKPNEYVSEKAFLKMVLTALGYEYNVDFNWNNVFYSAYAIGIVNDKKYITQVEDNLSYTRGNVVETLFKTLTIENKEKVQMIQSFLDNKTITKEYAAQNGLIADKVETDISEITAVSENEIEVTFNEEIKELLSGNILIYETENKSNVLKIDSIAKKEESNTYIIKVSDKQKSVKEYTMFIAQVKDFYGNNSGSFKKQFTSYGIPEVKSDYFKISKVEALSNNVINVYFTHPVNENALQASYYTLKQFNITALEGDNSNMIISKIPTCDNGVSIYLKDFVFNYEDYFQIQIGGNLTSMYGVLLNNGEGDTCEFKASIAPNEPLEMIGCSVISNNMVQLYFNKIINPTIAQQIFSYYITGENESPIKITKAEVVNDGVDAGKVVRLTVASSFDKKKEYNILVNHINDATRQFSITEKQYTFSGYYSEGEDVKVTEVIPFDANTLYVYINKPLDQESAEKASNYQLSGVSKLSYSAIPEAIYYDKTVDPYLLKLYLSKDHKLVQTDTYKLRVLETLKDFNGKTQPTTFIYQFSYNLSDMADTYISEAKIIGENTIKLNFNKEIALEVPNVLNTNYTLTYIENGIEYKKVPIGANYINPKTLILKFDNLDVDKEYKVTFSKLLDYGHVETDNDNNKYSTDVILGK